MTKEIELLAPGGDVDSIKAAILAGADAVYCGLDKFNARGRAKNITFDNLPGIIRLAHQHQCEIFLTVNIILVESEFPAMIKLLNRLVNTQIDGIIVQDLGLFYLLNRYFPTLDIHASTQLTTHNAGQIKFLKQLNASRVNLSRELDLNEIKNLSTVAHQHNMLTEVFVHGSNCISFSGLCYMSSVQGGNSGNRGRCSQPCRDQYVTTAEGKDFPLNIKDNSAFSDLAVLAEAGVDSIKVEGRIKKYHYVFTVIETWRKQLHSFYEQQKISHDNSELRKVFNRDFSNSFLSGEVGRDTFIDNPRDHSANHRAENYYEIGSNSSEEKLTKAKKELFDIKTEIINDVKTRIDQLSIDKEPLTLSFFGQIGTPLKIIIKSPELEFELRSQSTLVEGNADQDKSKKTLTDDLLLNRFKAINETGFFIDQLDTENLQPNLIVPFKELTALRKKVLFTLNDSSPFLAPIDPPRLKSFNRESLSPSLSVLISSQSDLELCYRLTENENIDIFFELPSNFKREQDQFVELFNNNPQLIPWFPAVLIGEDYTTAIEFLQQVEPKRIVTDNTGIAYEAFKMGISWYSGPQMNTVNSFSLLCMMENFNCEGAFISNEISRVQIKGIKKPETFKLFYSIYHPIVLMTSKVCFFHQVTGCKKNIVDNTCLQRCEKSSFITNLNEVSFFIKKTRGNYHNIYNQTHFLNTDIISNHPNLFDSLLIDLRDIETETRTALDKAELIPLFVNHLRGKNNSTEQLNKTIRPTTHTQYEKGI